MESARRKAVHPWTPSNRAGGFRADEAQASDGGHRTPTAVHDGAERRPGPSLPALVSEGG